MALPQVLLVEDDALLRRFVRMALEELPMTLLECDSVASALRILNTAPVQLVLTDLMLPGESGVALLQHLQDSPTLRGQAKVVVLSAGLTASTRQQLAPLGVWRMLDKPVSVGMLEQCVQDALSPIAQAFVPVAPTASPEQSDTIAQYFGGDSALFFLYRDACLAQLPHDTTAGNQACQDGDLQALRRVAHSLKTVLLTLGAPRLSAQALELEQLCFNAQPGTTVAWSQLCQDLLTWINLQKNEL